MTAPHHALHGDGVNFAFFNLLWSKSEHGDRNKDAKRQSDDDNRFRGDGKTKWKGEEQNPSILRVPDTVIFLFGQPHQWYFTSNNGGRDRDKTTILRKRRSNLTLSNIAEVFLNKAGEVGEDDAVAYFIGTNGDNDATTMEGHANIDVCGGAGIGNEAMSSIEYFNKKSLQDFLQCERNNKSGILQRFIAPHGGSYNSHIRAIWTPKLCILDRRRTKQNLHDARFALYERCITFDGPDIHSVSLPIQGTVLAKRVEGICKDIVHHVADVIAEGTRDCSRGMSTSNSKSCAHNTFFNVGRMVVDFKVDGNGRIWILWSNSIRLQKGSAENRMKLTDSYTHEIEPLNMDKLVRLPSSIKLTQAPNHDTSSKLENKLLCTTCPSCNNHDVNQNFQRVSYKIIIQHYEKTLEMLNESVDSKPSNAWPPQDRFIKAVGNVGFGSLLQQISRDREANPSRKYSKETYVIPPIIRELHPKLQVNGYNTYRQDPLFLLKSAHVCEACFLAFAQMASTSFTHVTRPIEPIGDKQYPLPNVDREKASSSGKEVSTRSLKNHPVSCLGNEFGSFPEFPPAITEPPVIENSESNIHPLPKDTLFNTMPIYFPSNDDAQKSLGHMIDSQQMLANANSAEVKVAATSKNPYEEKLDEMIG